MFFPPRPVDSSVVHVRRAGRKNFTCQVHMTIAVVHATLQNTQKNMTDTKQPKGRAYPAVQMLRMKPRQERSALLAQWHKPETLTVKAVNKKKVWLDCDPGHDDVMAIILAGFCPYIELLGISTVGGNQTVENTTLNACKIIAATGLKVKVFPGQENPLCRPARHGPEVHGDTGLDGCDFLKNIQPPEDIRGTTKGAIAMAQAVLHESEKVWIVATGSLTNVALAVTLYPEMIQNLHGISIMGGCLGIGNRGPVQEFNIFCDPEAAKIVFGLGKPPTELKIVMVPLEVTHTAIATKTVINTISNLNPHSPIPKMCTSLLQAFASIYHRIFGFSKGPPLHDPCAVAYIIDPSMFHVDHMNVEVETSATLTAGQTICDVWGFTQQPKCVYVCRSMNVSKFWVFMTDAIHAASGVNTDRAPVSPSLQGREPPVTAPGTDLVVNPSAPRRPMLAVRKMVKTKKNALPKKKSTRALDAGAPGAAAVAIEAELSKTRGRKAIAADDRNSRAASEATDNPTPCLSPGRKKKQGSASTSIVASLTTNTSTNVIAPEEPSDSKETPTEVKNVDVADKKTAKGESTGTAKGESTGTAKGESTGTAAASTGHSSRKRRAETTEGETKSDQKSHREH